MPWFRVFLHGQGIAYDLGEGGDRVIGFYTTRDVRAVDPVLAQQVALATVLDEWRGEGAYVAANRGDVPKLAVESCRPLGFWRRLFRARRFGYCFYSNED